MGGVGGEDSVPALREGLLGNRDKGMCGWHRSQWAGEDKRGPVGWFKPRWRLRFGRRGAVQIQLAVRL